MADEKPDVPVAEFRKIGDSVLDDPFVGVADAEFGTLLLHRT